MDEVSKVLENKEIREFIRVQLTWIVDSLMEQFNLKLKPAQYRRVIHEMLTVSV